MNELNKKYANPHLEDVDFRGIGLKHCQLQEAHLKRVDFTESYLQFVHFDYANIQEVDFIGSDLSYVYFTKATLQEIDFSRATIEDVRFCGTKNIPKSIRKTKSIKGMFIDEHTTFENPEDKQWCLDNGAVLVEE